MDTKSPLTVRTSMVLPLVKNANDAQSVRLFADPDKKNETIPITRPRLDKATALTDCSLRLFLQKIPFDIVVSVLVWYYVGVGMICSSKVLLSRYSVPPLVLTFQQLVIGSALLRLHLWATGGLQSISSLQKQEEPPRNRRQVLSVYHNLILTGIFNALDFFLTNKSFSLSSASFVETIKTSEPITTTAIAIFYGIEVLSLPEGLSMLVLVAGVFVSTLGNAAQGENGSPLDNEDDADLRWLHSIKACVVILSANILFALRIKSQKVLRVQPEWQKVSDANLLLWIQQAGAASLLLPLVCFELKGIMERTREVPWRVQMPFWALSMANACAYATYLLAQFRVLSKLSVAQFTGLSCLRRMNAIICTAVVFGVAVTPLSAFGILLSICGFSSFSYYRHKNPPGSNGRPAGLSSSQHVRLPLKATGMAMHA